jgi:hypothetical protein
MVARATEALEERIFETTCEHDVTQLNKITMGAKRVSAGLLHPKYQMELFRLEANSLAVEFTYEYDHSTFAINMTKTTLYDITGYPYTIDPK